MSEDNAAAQWFGEGWSRLHPLLQQLHRGRARLSGTVSLRFGRGLAGIIGRRLARSTGVPDRAGAHALRVDIEQREGALHWQRCFDGAALVVSSFQPHGHWPGGYWLEATGPLELKLAVDILEGGWYWRALAARWRGRRVPLWLMPRAIAFKRIEQGRYRFYVGVGLPLLGELFSYSGLLEAETG